MSEETKGTAETLTATELVRKTSHHFRTCGDLRMAVALVETRDSALHAELVARCEAMELAVAQWARNSAALGPLSGPAVKLIETVGAMALREKQEGTDGNEG